MWCFLNTGTKETGDNMDFNEAIKQFSKRVGALKETIKTEEATKMSLIVPIFQLLEMLLLPY